MMENKNSIWYILVALALFSVMMFNCGIGYYCLSLLVVPITSEFGLPSAAFSFVYSFYGIGSALAAASLPWAVKRTKLDRLITIGGVLCASSFLIVYVSSSMIPIYLSGVLGGISSVYGGTAVVQLVIAKWYRKGRTAITGLVASASGVGAAIFSPIMGKLILLVEWRMVCLLTAGFIFMVSVVSIALVRQDPEAVGLKPYGLHALGVREGKGMQITENGIALKTAMKTRLFPIYLVGVVAVTLSYYVITSSQSAILIEKGGSIEFVSYCLALFSIADMCCKTVSGIIIEKWGFRPAVVYCGLALIVGVLVIQTMDVVPLTMVLFSICAGCWPTMLVLYGVTVSTTVFGGKYLTQYVSFTQTVIYGCSIMVGPCINWLFGIQGNYNLLIWTVLGCVVLYITTVLLLFAKRQNYEGAAV